MENEETSFPGGAGSVADGVRLQRRKAAYRRRFLGVLIGVPLVLGLIFWQRNRGFIQQCESSLNALGKASSAMHLESEPMELIESSWLALKADSALGAGHYQALAVNWSRRPGTEEAVPLAMCAEPHGSLSGQGRNVLFRTATGFETRWVDEETAESMLALTFASPSKGFR